MLRVIYKFITAFKHSNWLKIIFLLLQTLFTKQEGNNCNTLTPCPLVMDNDTLTSSCVYECPCDQNGCDVTYFESQLDYKDRTGDACALQVLGEV